MNKVDIQQTIFDIIVVGSGPGGYVTAIRAAQLGMNVAIVEDKHLGGICLNWGCIPTKSLLRSAEVYRTMQHARDYGLECKANYNLEAIIKRSRNISEQLSKGVSHLLKKNNVTVINGFGKLVGGRVGSRTLLIEKDGESSTILTAKNIILATGSRAKVIKGIEPDNELIWSYKEALIANRVPNKLVILGSGAIGIEFASFFNTLGSNITVIEVQDDILPIEDKEVSLFAKKSFEKQGMQILTKTSIKEVKKQSNNLKIITNDDRIIEADCLLVAAGIVGNIENIGLEGSKIKVDNTHIVTNEWSETGEEGIYAIGDVAGAPWLAHKASHEGIVCVEKIAKLEGVKSLDKSSIAGCTYSYPQIASVGLTEEQAKDSNKDIKVGKFPFMANGKAISLGETEGFIKTIFDVKTGELLGVHMVGAEVTELISGYSIARKLETTEQELMHTVFPHPTLSEMMHESVLDAFNKALHI